MPPTDHDTDFRELLDTFDYQRWSIACREMQVRILRGDIPAAHTVIDTFARFTGYTPATLYSPLCAVLPIRVANQLEQAGYHTLASIDSATDATLLSDVRNFSEVSLAVVRQCIERN